MKIDFREKQRRKAREENEGKLKGCFHDKDHWCQNCIAKPKLVDFTKEGLGKGYIISNFFEP